MRASMFLFMVLALTAAPSLSQPAKTDLTAARLTPTGAYLVPFASTANVLELTVANPGEQPLTAVRVAVGELPAWLVVAPSEVVFEEVAGGGEAVARFALSVGQTAPVGQAVSVPLTITSGSAVVGEKQILVEVEAPREVALRGNYPNPFNPSTTISYVLAEEGRVDLRVYDMLGREVARLVRGIESAGYHETVWEGGRFASGVYVYRLEVESELGGRRVKQRTMLLVK